MAMTKTFYLDESGHSGDLATTGPVSDFLDQPFFVLAAVGMTESTDFAAEIEALRATHRIPPGELKSKSLQSKPIFVAALFDVVFRHELPLFIEVVDKKYFVGVNIVQWLLLPPAMGFREGPQKHFLQNTLAELLYEEASEHVLNRFVQACLEPSDEAVMNAFGSLFLLNGATPKHARNRDLMEGLHMAAVQSGVEYCSLRKGDESAYMRFLPPIDLNRHGKRVWMLPNQSSFANICARINLFRGGDMAGVRLVHDQQLEVAKILRDTKEKLEMLKDTAFRPFTPSADYLITSKATLEFGVSHEQFGIQIADVIAGATMRYFRDEMRRPQEVHPALKHAMKAVLRLSNSDSGWGVNLVGPDEHRR